MTDFGFEMSKTVLTAVITGIITALPAWLAYRQGLANKKAGAITDKEVKEIHKAVNSTATHLAEIAKHKEQQILALTEDKLKAEARNAALEVALAAKSQDG